MPTAETEVSNQIVLKNVRLSYPQLFKPKAFAGGDEGSAKYSASFLLDKVKDAKQIEAVKAVIQRLLTANKMKQLPADKLCLRDGASKGDKEGYTDEVMFISASNSRRPQVVDSNANGRSPLDENSNKIYGGIYVNAVINLWAQQNAYGKRINASLEAVQFARTGEAFGSAPVDTDTAFGDLPDVDEEVDMLGD